jgi:hypothetical protein
MKSSRDRKRDQRKRARTGIEILRVEVRDPKTLCEMFREKGFLKGGDHMLPHAISGYLDEMGGKYRKGQAQEKLAEIFPSRTGLADRETEPCWSDDVVKPKDLQPEVRIDWTQVVAQDDYECLLEEVEKNE